MAKSTFNLEQQIFLCTDTNPRAGNGATHLRFNLYFKCRTVGEFLAAGGWRGDILWDVKRGHILLDWEGASVPAAEGVQAAAPRVTTVRSGKAVSKPVGPAKPAAKASKGEDFFKRAEEAKLAKAITAKSGVRMENLVVRVAA